ncbi:porin OmpA [Scandinavium goeteborgense]|uniref:Outer membrane protein A n=1 Tax=Scandinavium goeteborgense TaxID=1851514 RepID=A0A4R6EI04_SCAGO|nr:porin OmpA [Scandinavium goeteborgense]QKN80355.1 porin OmpA [Scandinavium goeteborgense]TDN58181.1 OOP family OmpA-OmpF porin [Scandinavium goeteborgense]
MKKTLVALIVLNACAVSSAFAAGNANTWYAGAKFGWSHYADVSGNKDFNDSLSASNDFNVDHDNVGGGVFGGYQITNWLAVEGGYDYLGNMQFNGNNGVNGAKMKSQGLQLSLKTSYALTDDWDLYGRFGAMGYRAETDVAGHNKFETGVRPVVAAGTEYAFTKNWAGRLEYQWVSNVGNSNQIGLSSDVHSVTAGIVYRFGQNDDVAPVVAPAPAPEVKTFNLKSDVMFGYDSAALTDEGKAAIDQLYNSPEMQAAKDKNTTVIGYSDRTGQAEYNQQLSARRAQAVADQLVADGMPAANIQTEGRGANDSVTGNSCDNQSGNALINCLSPDRRVVVQISGQ